MVEVANWTLSVTVCQEKRCFFLSQCIWFPRKFMNYFPPAFHFSHEHPKKREILKINSPPLPTPPSQCLPRGPKTTLPPWGGSRNYCQGESKLWFRKHNIIFLTRNRVQQTKWGEKTLLDHLIWSFRSFFNYSLCWIVTCNPAVARILLSYK